MQIWDIDTIALVFMLSVTEENYDWFDMKICNRELTHSKVANLGPVDVDYAVMFSTVLHA